MNERIKELAERLDTWYPDQGWFIFNDEQLEKFAQLIVKECAGVAEVSMPINSHPDDRLIVKNSVLKHFGGEE